MEQRNKWLVLDPFLIPGGVVLKASKSYTIIVHVIDFTTIGPVYHGKISSSFFVYSHQ